MQERFNFFWRRYQIPGPAFHHRKQLAIKFISRKQQFGESLEQFHAVLSGRRNATTYASAGGTATSSTTGGGMQIKTEPVGVIRGGYRKNRERARGQTQGRGHYRGGTNVGDRSCYNCDKPGFISEHMNECATKEVTGNFCKRLGYFERTCRAEKNNRARSSVGMIQVQDGQELFESEEMEDDASQHESSVGWLIQPKKNVSDCGISTARGAIWWWR